MKDKYFFIDEAGGRWLAQRWNFAFVAGERLALAARDHEILRLAEGLEASVAEAAHLRECYKNACAREEDLCRQLETRETELRDLEGWRVAVSVGRPGGPEDRARAAEAEADRLKIENEGFRGDIRRLRDACLSSAEEIQGLRLAATKRFRLGFSAGVQAAIRQIRSVAIDMELQEAADADS